MEAKGTGRAIASTLNVSMEIVVVGHWRNDHINGDVMHVHCEM